VRIICAKIDDVATAKARFATRHISVSITAAVIDISATQNELLFNQIHAMIDTGVNRFKFFDIKGFRPTIHQEFTVVGLVDTTTTSYNKSILKTASNGTSFVRCSQQRRCF
jgi:hypothetical protein